MLRTYFTDSDTLNDYLEYGCDDGSDVTHRWLDQAACEIAAKSRYVWSEREALAFCATLSDDERRRGDELAFAAGDPARLAADSGYHATQVAFGVIYDAALADLDAALAQFAADDTTT